MTLLDLRAQPLKLFRQLAPGRDAPLFDLGPLALVFLLGLPEIAVVSFHALGKLAAGVLRRLPPPPIEQALCLRDCLAERLVYPTQLLPGNRLYPHTQSP